MTLNSKERETPDTPETRGKFDIEFFNDSASDIEGMLRRDYPLRGGHLPSGHHRGNHRTATHLTGLHARRLADIYKSMNVVESEET